MLLTLFAGETADRAAAIGDESDAWLRLKLTGVVDSTVWVMEDWTSAAGSSRFYSELKSSFFCSKASLSRFILLLYFFLMMISSPFGVMIGILGTVITARDGNTKRHTNIVRWTKALTFVQILLVLAEDVTHDLIEERATPVLGLRLLVILLIVLVDLLQLELLQRLNLAVQLFRLEAEPPLVISRGLDTVVITEV